jgi:large subunit ribosomal protein L33
MKNRKTSRVKISMDCFICLSIENRPGVSRYYSQKNKKNTNYKLAFRKYCKFCHNHNSHNENK